MNDDNNNLTIDSSPTSSLTLPTIEPNEKLLSSMSTSTAVLPVEPDDSTTPTAADDDDDDDDDNAAANPTESSSHPPSVDEADKRSPASPRAIISDILDTVIAQIESTNDNQLQSLPVIEDDQMEIEEDEEEDDENDDDDDEDRESVDKPVSSKSTKTDKEQTPAKTLSSAKTDLKPTTRTLRSHARGRRNLATFAHASGRGNSHVRRVSSRRQALDSKVLLTGLDRERKRRTPSERSRKDKDSTLTNEDVQTSSNSDDQASENANDKSSMTATGNTNDEGSSCSSTGPGDESSTSSSTTNTKQPNVATEIDSLPPNKRRLRERNAAAAANASTASMSGDAAASSNSTSAADASPVESTTTREIPTNSIKQFLEIRQQIDKRHETMLHEFVLPKVPKDFPETTMAKKSYLIAPAFSSYANTTSFSMGIKRLLAPHELEGHLADVFGKQEDERYRMKLRHQVERDKLVLSHEQEILRLYGNATRSSASQDTPFSYCSLLKDNEVYNNPSIQLPEKLLNNDYTNTELSKRGKHRGSGRSFIKWLEESNLKYKRLSCELNSRQRLEAETLYSMQRMVWLKHIPKDATSLSASAVGRLGYLLSERYLPRVEINTNFWTHWEPSLF